jgi:hypothetical protein
VYDKDPRYDAIKLLIEAGRIQSIKDIFTFIPKTTVYKDLGINFNRFDRAITDPSIFRMQELITLAELFGVDALQFIYMAYKQSRTVHRSKDPLAEKASNL